MHPRFRRSLATATLPLVLWAPQNAWAQDVTDSSAAVETADASPDVSGNAIIVTARRRAESMQDIPIAVSIVGGDDIDATGSFNVNKLQQLQPSLQFYSSNPRNTAVNVRGLGAPFGLTNDGIEQGVGIYVDDVYYSRVASATFDFLDVAQIETLRGPQGTLYGKNTTAGAINITTRAPSFDFEGRAEVTLGNLEYKQAKASVSGPLSSTVAARLAIAATSRRGTIYNVATATHINEQDNIGLRGQLLWQPSGALDVTLAADYSRQNPECCAQIYVGTGLTQRALNRQYAALSALQGYSVPSTNAFDRVTDVDADLNAKNIMGGASLRGVLDLGAGTLTSVTAWRFWDWTPANDRDFTGLPITTRSQNPSQQKQYTQELRYNQSGETFDFVIGAFGFHQTVRTQGTQEQGPAASRWLLNPSSPLSLDPSVLNGLTATNDIRLDNTSAALYGQVTWKVSDAFSIQPGFRVNYDKKSGLYSSVVTDAAGNLVLFGQTDPIKVAQRGVLAPQFFEPSFSDWNFSYDLTAHYKIAPDVMVYATYARSFKSGGINLNGVPTDAAGVPIVAAGTIRPEKVNHFEVGLKSQFFDRKATLNLAGFWTEIDDYQAVVTNGQLGVLRGYLANAEKVRVRGVEADFTVRPSDRLRLGLSAAYTDHEYTKFTDAPCPPELSGGTSVGAGQPPGAPGVPGSLSPENCDISGQWLPGISNWALAWSGEYNVPAKLLGLDGEVYAGVDGNYRSKFSSNASRSAYTDVKGYALTNLRFGFRAEDRWNIFGWVRNAFDVNYYEQLAVPSGNTGLIVGQPGDPRTYGLTLSSTF